jgi:tripartite-type tricarboxylate transporter receptor subunit TctC
MKTKSGFLAALALVLAWAPAVLAQTAGSDAFPSRPVRLIVAFPPGQATDIVARLFAEELTKRWGRQVVVENRAGGASVPGTLAGRDAPPDGYTITFATSSSLAVNKALSANLAYDPQRDFAMVHGVFTVPWAIVAHPSAPYSTLKELLQASKSDPDKLSWGYGASSLQLGGEFFKLITGARITGVPYKGSGPAMTDLLGGQIPLLLDTVAATLPHIKSGRMKAIATLSPKRVPLLPDVPTVDELGYAGFEAEGWGGMVVPRATPAAVVTKISGDVRQILGDASVRQRMLDRGVVPDLRGPEEWTKFVHAEVAKWTDVARRANVKGE